MLTPCPPPPPPHISIVKKFLYFGTGKSCAPAVEKVTEPGSSKLSEITEGARPGSILRSYPGASAEKHKVARSRTDERHKRPFACPHRKVWRAILAKVENVVPRDCAPTRSVLHEPKVERPPDIRPNRRFHG